MPIRKPVICRSYLIGADRNNVTASQLAVDRQLDGQDRVPCPASEVRPNRAEDDVCSYIEEIQSRRTMRRALHDFLSGLYLAFCR